MLVKMCFDNPHALKGKPAKSNVNPTELMRFHPIFNTLSYHAIKDFLQETKLCKLMAGKLLYAHNEKNTNVYIILFGKIVLHHDKLGALGVLTMENTLGEES